MIRFEFLQQRYVVHTYPNRGLTLVKGQGVYLYDENGNRYLDMMSNYGVNMFGYSHPTITAALTEQLKKLSNLHGSFTNDVRARVARQLIERTNGFSQLFFSNSGAEAIEAALKFIAVATGKKKIIAAEHSYHGKTLGALSVTSGEKYRKPFEPFSWKTIFVKYGNLSNLKKVVDKKTAAFIIEPVQGEGGLATAPKGYLKEVKKICKERGILLVFDEIQSGTGRTGKFLASEWDGVSPDILCLGKGIAGGLPVGITLVSKEIAEKIPRNIHTTTFGGNPLTCAGIIATLNLLDKNRLAHICEVGVYFRRRLAKIKSNLVAGVRGKGLMIGIDIKDSKRNEILQLLQQNNILAIPAGDTVIRFLPPYIIQKKHIDTVINVLQKIL